MNNSRVHLKRSRSALNRLALWPALALLAISAVDAGANAEQTLDALLAEHLEETLRRNPVRATYLGDHRFNDRFEAPLSQARWAEDKQRAARWLQRADAIDPSRLSEGGRLAWESFRFDRQMELRGYDFPGYYLPLNQIIGWHIDFPAYAAGDSIQPFNTVEDYDAFLARAWGFAQWMLSAMEAMREGAAQGITLPRPIVRRVLPQLKAHIVDKPEDSAFYQAVEAMPEHFPRAERKRLRREYRRLIQRVLAPMYRRFYYFMRKQYLPSSRHTVALGDLPEGAAWYAWEIARRTTLPLSAGEVHDLGLREVARIRGEMERVKRQVEFNGDLAAFFAHLKADDQFYFDSEEALLEHYRRTLDDIRGRLPRLFRNMPRSQLEVRPVEPWRAASAPGASYQNAPADGSRPGIFYINTHNLRAQPWFYAQTLSLHEALPGHYYQGALQIENSRLPAHRRYSAYTAYAEGWALYAESLGGELGLFAEPMYWYGRLSDEQLRAMRLVVDTGLHARGWSRERAIRYMRENSSMAESDITAEVERYIAWPGQALAYKIGDLRIQALRREMERALGARFDIREFHHQILKDGELPLPVLERKIRRWGAAQARAGRRSR